MGKFVITEEEKKYIKGLYEQQISGNTSFNYEMELPKYGFKKNSSGSFQKTINNEKGQKIYDEIITPVPEFKVINYLLYTFGKPELKFPTDLNITMETTKSGWNKYISIDIPISRIPDIIRVTNSK